MRAILVAVGLLWAGCCGGVFCPTGTTCVNNQCVPVCSLNPQVKPPLFDKNGARLVPAPPAGLASVSAEARASYLLAVVQNLARHEFTKEKCAATNNVSECVGIDVTSVSLTQADRADGRANLLTARFTVFMFGTNGEHVPLPGREYGATIRLVPYVIDDRVAERDRRALLGCGAGDACKLGLVLDGDYETLLGGPHASGPNGMIDCHTIGFDYIDTAVMLGIQGLTGDPTKMRRGFSLDPLLDGAKKATALSGCNACTPDDAPLEVSFAGVDLETDGDLRLGVGLAIGAINYSPPAFDGNSLIRAANEADFGVSIDIGLLRRLARRLAERKVTCASDSARHYGVHLDDLQIDFVQAIGVPAGTIHARAVVRIEPPICNHIMVTANAVVRPQVCTRLRCDLPPDSFHALPSCGAACAGHPCTDHLASVAMCLDPPAIDIDRGGVVNDLCLGTLGAVVGVILDAVARGGLPGFFEALGAIVVGPFVAGTMVFFGPILLPIFSAIVETRAGNEAKGCTSVVEDASWSTAPGDNEAGYPLGNLHPSGFYLNNVLLLTGRSDLIPHTSGCYQCPAGQCTFPYCSHGCESTCDANRRCTGQCLNGDCVFPSGSCGNCDQPPCCLPKTCPDQGLECGPATDTCGKLIDCGSCGGGDTCGGGGVPRKCGHKCAPQTCAQQHLECGLAGDTCGKPLNCGTCAAPLVCASGKCGPAQTCTTCQAQGKNCDSISDNCGHTLNCGTCAAGSQCVNGQCVACGGCSNCNANDSCGQPCGCPNGGVCRPDGSCLVCPADRPYCDDTGTCLPVIKCQGGRR